MSAAGRYIRTVARLKPRQILTRALRTVTRPRVSTGPAPTRRVPVGSPVRPIEREEGWVSPTKVRLLNVERELGGAQGAIDWRPSDVERLWVYNLHYFADLPQERHGRGWADALVGSWIASNPPGTRDAWDPYPISLRAVNWIKWMLVRDADGGAARREVLDGLATQLRFLEKRVEYDVSANHLMANAVALTVGGLFFRGAEGDRWLRKGLGLLERQVREQVDEDGGHYERSPMYHAVVLEQLLDVLNIWSVFPDVAPSLHQKHHDVLEAAALGMFNWLTAMTHPDGGAAFFNDTTLGASPSLGELVDYAHRQRLQPGAAVFAGITRMSHSGFFRMRSGDGRNVLFFDVGGPEPGHQPGHAHAGSLSFELSREGRRIFVNSGVSTYEPGPVRSWQRLTAAHNTVRIDEVEQSELWASHRCGRRARVSRAGVRDNCAYAEHTGYAHLPGRPVHRREICVTDASVEVVDKISGDGEHLLEWFFHLHPDVTASVVDRGVELRLDGKPLAKMVFPFGAAASVSGGTWHPAFGSSVPNSRVHVALRASLPFESHATVRWL